VVVAVLACASSSGVGGGSRAGSDGRPQWVQGEHPRFPRSGYITGVGSGASLDAARNGARAEIARIFESRVEAVVADQATWTREATSEGGATSEVFEKLVVSTSVATKGDFQELRVPETWFDRKTDTHYALAVLDKAKLRARLRPELEGAAERVAGHLSRADRAATSLERVRAMVAALRASRERDAIASRARVVGSPRVENLASTAEIERELAEALDRVRFIVQVVEVDAATGAERGEIPLFQARLSQAITDMGFPVVDVDGVSGSSGAAPLWLAGRVSLQEVPRDLPNTCFVRWEAALDVVGRNPRGSVVLSAEATGGESFSTLELARKRAIAKGSSQLARDITRKISRYLREDLEH
jgi:hypothetical protein